MPKGPPTLPKIALSKKRLRETWTGSRDATSKPAKPGIDFQTPVGFAQKFDANIDRLHSELMERRFRFFPLKAAIIPKDSGKNRVICIPTVRDRLVQRTIMTWLVAKKKVPHQDFVYGIKGQPVKAAIKRAVELRATFDWCIKTDIQSFFDQISRPKLKSLIEKDLKHSSLIPLLFSAIDLEIKPRNVKQATEIEAAGIKHGIGIRQGMPLSPLLANFSLKDFDATCKSNGIKILRYADDILAFFHTKEEAKAGFDVIKTAIKKLELFVPDIGDSKTERLSRSDPVSFLGREIVYLETAGCFTSRVSDKKLNGIKNGLLRDYALHKVIEENSTLDEAISSLSASVRSYLGAYKDAHNFAHFESEIRGHYKLIIREWFRQIFGAEAIEKLSPDQRNFLGLQIVQDLNPEEDFDITN